MDYPLNNDAVVPGFYHVGQIIIPFLILIMAIGSAYLLRLDKYCSTVVVEPFLLHCLNFS